MSISVLVPKGFNKIAETELNTGISSFFYNKERDLFFLVVRDPVEDVAFAFGPAPKRVLTSLLITVADVNSGV